jgi:hypothetical protein
MFFVARCTLLVVAVLFVAFFQWDWVGGLKIYKSNYKTLCLEKNLDPGTSHFCESPFC